MKRIDTDALNENVVETVAREEILRLSESQRSHLATRFDDLLGDGGPPDETADEMIRAIREWRPYFHSEPRLVALVLDTDVLSYLYKRNTRAELYRPHLNDSPN
jgi:hypothetical protein